MKSKDINKGIKHNMQCIELLLEKKHTNPEATDERLYNEAIDIHLEMIATNLKIRKLSEQPGAQAQSWFRIQKLGDTIFPNARDLLVSRLDVSVLRPGTMALENLIKNSNKIKIKKI